jgi:hypothetical protein
MEQVNESIKNCDYIIQKLGEINAKDLRKLYDCEYISKSITHNLIKRIDKLFEVTPKPEDEQVGNEVELYNIIKTKLNLLLSSCNNKTLNGISEIACTIRNKKLLLDYDFKGVLDIMNFIEHNKSFVKSEDIDNFNLHGVQAVRHIENPDGERTCVMTVITDIKSRSKCIDILLPKQYNNFRTYKLVIGINVKFVNYKTKTSDEIVNEIIFYGTSGFPLLNIAGQISDFIIVLKNLGNENA